MAPSSSSLVDLLLQEANTVRCRAYAPYSHFLVGSALQDDQGRIFSGCNFENSSYGATICAERNAIGAMVAAGSRSFSTIVIVTDTPQGSPPCGLCLQVLSEFAKQPRTAQIHLANLSGIVRTFHLIDLMPEAFSSQELG